MTFEQYVQLRLSLATLAERIGCSADSGSLGWIYCYPNAINLVLHDLMSRSLTRMRTRGKVDLGEDGYYVWGGLDQWERNEQRDKDFLILPMMQENGIDRNIPVIVGVGDNLPRIRLNSMIINLISVGQTWNRSNI